MCGISGFNFEDKSLVKKMCDLIRHRGPNDSGYYTNSEISIGMRRLSIIDLATGQQPQHNENEDIWIVFNGEIYNFKKLRNELQKKGHQFYTESDTEVIIHSYEEWGDNCVKKLRGAFAFCIYDSRKKIFFLARDHLGLKPLYYFFDGNLFIFGSEIKCILCHNIKREIDKEALNLYLSLRYTPFTSTLFKGIYKLPPSCYLKLYLENKNLEINEYWNIYFNIDYNKSESQLVKELKLLLEESIKIRLVSDVPLGAFLSGGIDSTSIVALMSKFMDEPVKTFSIGFAEGAAIDETKYSRYVAEYYNTDHTEIIVDSAFNENLKELIWYFDDLINDPAIIPVHLMALHAKKNMTVALTGDGADEVFAGYSSWYRAQRFDHYNFLPKKSIDFFMKFYRFLPSFKARMALSYIYRSKTLEDIYFRGILQFLDEEKDSLLYDDVENVQTLIRAKFMKNLDIINQFTYWDLRYQLPNLYNMKIDKMTMAASLEARVPYLDHKLVSWASTIPSDLKLKGNVEKYILRLALKDIIPPEILKRKKYGFGTPVFSWLKTGFKDSSGEILERLERRNYIIKPDYVKKIRKNRLNQFFVTRVFSLIMFELWYETFIENQNL